MANKQQLGALILRVVLGLTFLLHGLDKFQGGIENIVGFFESIGLPGFLAYVVGTIELVGGILLILGLGTRAISFLLMVIMVGATLKVKLAAGFIGGYEFDLALFTMALYLALNGSSMAAVDNLLPYGKKETA
ncbi:DoxX family protein [Brevibacillus sp. 7WMA2]|uniref:Putative oxidoreductase CatD n=1 Tax=Brevibacillus laterosporus LMG 15441 TaxID=1042163 RepID=A0A075QZQ0_BRELA|nr:MULTISPECIES: DoxX family protein [Brevibacillus]MBA4533961.1 DoxX family protein [Brevibacillus halotolerans]HAS00343.1 DoxX family protein [Brevibacillus sp.]AIG24691.1 putative oxidoreductase CatD [Brevibacillus laterosporus LMG 15441]AUM63343.1 DoxX family protein [Brevibacillus laterosporus]AYK06353.1 DoxX family protein [Brevibacillus laterosporus]